MIWSTKIQEHSSTHKAGGKGFTGGKQTTFSYSASFAFAFAAGPAAAILRMWADSKPFYDVTAGVVSIPNVPMRIYLGTEDQLPDPAIEADKGAGQVPGFRGLVYVVFENVPLAIFGNRIPNISAEVAFSGQTALQMEFQTYTVPHEADPYYPNSASGNMFSNFAFDFARNQFYREMTGVTPTDGLSHAGVGVINLHTMEMFRVVTVDQMYAGTGFPEPNFTWPFGGSMISLDSGNGTDLFICMSHDSLLPTEVMCIRVNPDIMKVTGQCDVFRVGVLGLTDGVKGCVNQGFKQSGSRVPYICYPAGSGVLAVDGDSMTYLGTVLTGSFTGGAGIIMCQGQQNSDGLGACDFWCVETDSGTGGNHINIWRLRFLAGGTVHTELTVAMDSTSINSDACCRVARVEYDRTHDALLMWVQTGATDSDAQFSPTAGTPVLVAINPGSGLVYWANANAGGGGDAKGASLIDGTSFGYVDGASHVKKIDTATGATLVDQAVVPINNGFFSSVYNSRTDSSFDFYLGVGLQVVRFSNATANEAVLGDIVRDICVESGLETGDVDTTSLTDLVRGYTHTQENARTLISDLANAFFFDSAETDYTLKFVKRGGASALTIPYSNVVPPANNTPALPISRNQAEELPRRVWIRYPDVEHDQQQGTQHVNRSQAPESVSVINSAGEQTLDLRVVYNASEAKTVALKRLMMLWAERESFSNVGLPPSYMALDPTDVITLTTRDGSTSRVRIERTGLGADLEVMIGGTIEDATLTGLSATGDGGTGITQPPLLPTDYTPIVTQVEMPLLRDFDDTGGTALRQYGTFGAYPGQSFGGAALYTSADNATWNLLFMAQTSMTWGYAVNTLAAPSALFCIDDTNVLDVYMAFGGDTLETITTEQLTEGVNPAVLITTNGEAEVLQFTTVTPLGGDMYRLSGLVRGRRGTEWVCGLHTGGDRFVMLDRTAWRENVVSLAWLGLIRYDKLLGVWDTMDSVPSYQRTYLGTAEKPYAPCQLEGTRDGSNNLTITWQRRDRFTAEWYDLFEVAPLNEATESYEIDIYSGTTVVRTLTASTNSVAYSFADQTTDGVDALPIPIKVYQISATVGRGYGGYCTLADPSGVGGVPGL